MIGWHLLSLWLAAAPANASACLECHAGQAKGQVDGKVFHVNAHGEMACSDCHADISAYPHPAHVAKVECSACHDEPASDVAQGPHSAPGNEACVSCHGQAHAIARPTATTQLCATCHGDVATALSHSVHAVRPHGTDAPTCRNCHGPAHKVRAQTDPTSSVSKANVATTCGTCHANPEFTTRHPLLMARPVEAYRLSVHGRAIAAGNLKAATCSDCHGSHDVRMAKDPAASINHFRVPATCGKCHTQIVALYHASVHGQAVRHGSEDAPVCTDCHGEHDILAPSEPGSPVNPARVSSATCGRCHANARLAAKYNLPLDKVPDFENSYHGLALRAGSQSVANCASCHGVHDILPSSDPRSAVNPKNLAHTCGACHPGAGTRFVIGRVHVSWTGSSVPPLVRAIRAGYVFFLIPVTLGLMVLHNALDFLAKLLRGGTRLSGDGEISRMNLHFRIAHLLVVVSFLMLVWTGFALTFPASWWAAPVIPIRGVLHRTAAAVLLLAMGYHTLHLLLVRRDRVILKQLLPTLQDALDAWQLVRHNLGFKVQRPHFGKFSYAEKAEYWAFVWGAVVMAGSGFLLWFNNWTLAHLPKWTTDAATVVHFYEAVLASLAILIWHFYMVVFDPEVYPMDRAWITGKVPIEHLRHTRPAYLRALAASEEPESADAEPPVPPADEPPATPPAEPSVPAGPDDGKT